MTPAQRFHSGSLLRHSAWITSVIFSALVLGCTSSTENRSDTVAPLPFVFRKLELEQKKSGGDVDWKLSSPEARYELSRRLVRAKQPVGVLYSKNKPSFKLRADFAVVVNDGDKWRDVSRSASSSESEGDAEAAVEARGEYKCVQRV